MKAISPMTASTNSTAQRMTVRKRPRAEPRAGHCALRRVRGLLRRCPPLVHRPRRPGADRRGRELRGRRADARPVAAADGVVDRRGPAGRPAAGRFHGGDRTVRRAGRGGDHDHHGLSDGLEVPSDRTRGTLVHNGVQSSNSRRGRRSTGGGAVPRPPEARPVPAVRGRAAEAREPPATTAGRDGRVRKRRPMMWSGSVNPFSGVCGDALVERWSVCQVGPAGGWFADGGGRAGARRRVGALWIGGPPQ